MPKKFPCCLKLVYFHSSKNSDQASGIVITSATKHHPSHKSLKIKFKALKELEKGTPREDFA